MRAVLARGVTLLAKPFVSGDIVRRVRETLDSDKVVTLSKIPDINVGR
jgi:hypothetical protein